MMEHNPKEAVKVNIFGTYTVAKIARECQAERFIMISTDKAVRPTSIMGATKRVAEYVCQAFNSVNRESGMVNGEELSAEGRAEMNSSWLIANSERKDGETVKSQIPNAKCQIVNGTETDVHGKENVEHRMLNVERSQAGQGGATKFISVRFGNVLGSRGSVTHSFWSS
jgi:FlaA1/EpsC-like NDP-sugar epimerase